MRFDDRAISLYARGLTVREIQGHLAEIYGTEVSPDLISKITDTVLSDAKAWQNRPLERVYPIVYLDALIVKIRDGHTVRNQACYVALASTSTASVIVLGLWFQQPSPRIASTSSGAARLAVSQSTGGGALLPVAGAPLAQPERPARLAKAPARPVACAISSKSRALTATSTRAGTRPTSPSALFPATPPARSPAP